MKKSKWYRGIVLVILFLMCLAPSAFCHISNEGNVETRIVITAKNGDTSSTALLPEEDMPLPDDAVQVKVDNPDFDRGNEDVFIRITLPDGTEGRIYENGGVFNVPAPGTTHQEFQDRRGV